MCLYAWTPPPPPPCSVLFHFVSDTLPHYDIISSHLAGGVSGGLSASANRSYSPRASPLHVSALSGPQNVKSVLARIDQSRSLRQLVLDAKKVCSPSSVLLISQPKNELLSIILLGVYIRSKHTCRKVDVPH